ncbi:hypothetical protein [Krasilnikovia sp. MM14-A1259]|uniref:hypothetical protein n=1 Tax=Krasilnikovia sp. MM14-A1259 TaxID=3373539 RepID=UPI00381D432A
MRSRIVALAVAGLATAATAGAVYSTATHADTHTNASVAQVAQAPKNATQSKIVIHTDHAEMDSAADLSDYSDYVVSGSFAGIAKKGLASDYGLVGKGDPNDPTVNLWNFHVDRVIKGSGPSDVLVLRYDDEQVESDEAPVSKGMDTVLFLTDERNGARAVVGGDQGMLLREDNGDLTRVDPGQGELTDASSVAELTETVE